MALGPFDTILNEGSRFAVNEERPIHIAKMTTIDGTEVTKDVAFDFVLHSIMYQFFRECDAVGLRFVRTERSRQGTHIKSRYHKKWIKVEDVEWPHIEVWCEEDKCFGKMTPPKVLQTFLKRTELTPEEKRAEGSIIQWAYDTYMIELAHMGEEMIKGVVKLSQEEEEEESTTG